MYTVVSLEILLLCAVGMPVGLGLGLLSATGILTAATSLLSPELFLAQDTAMLQQLIQENQGGKGLFLFLSVFITLSFAFVAAIPAARAAARFPRWCQWPDLSLWESAKIEAPEKFTVLSRIMPGSI